MHMFELARCLAIAMLCLIEQCQLREATVHADVDSTLKLLVSCHEHMLS